MELINKRIGISEEASTIANLLTRMCLRSEVVDEGKSINVEIPPTRAGELIRQDSKICFQSVLLTVSYIFAHTWMHTYAQILSIHVTSLKMWPLLLVSTT